MLIGPGGAGKGTLAGELVARDPTLWLSRSWTTRSPRPGEREREAYVFVDRRTFEEAIGEGRFLEWAEFLDQLMGTPIPDPPAGSDVLLEIDIQGAEQVLARRPDATVILLLPPSAEIQAQRLAARGDDDEHIARRVELGRSEVVRGRRNCSSHGGERRPRPGPGRTGGYSRADPSGCPLRRETGGTLMAQGRHTLMDPPIEELLDKVDSKFTLVALGSAHARQVNSYYNSLGEGLGKVVPPQVASVSGKPVSIAFEEIAAGKATFSRPDPEEEAAIAAAIADAAEQGLIEEAPVIEVLEGGSEDPSEDPTAG